MHVTCSCPALKLCNFANSTFCFLPEPLLNRDRLFQLFASCFHGVYMLFSPSGVFVEVGESNGKREIMFELLCFDCALQSTGFALFGR